MLFRPRFQNSLSEFVFRPCCRGCSGCALRSLVQSVGRRGNYTSVTLTMQLCISRLLSEPAFISWVQQVLSDIAFQTCCQSLFPEVVFGMRLSEAVSWIRLQSFWIGPLSFRTVSRIRIRILFSEFVLRVVRLCIKSFGSECSCCFRSSSQDLLLNCSLFFCFCATNSMLQSITWSSFLRNN